MTEFCFKIVDQNAGQCITDSASNKNHEPGNNKIDSKFAQRSLTITHSENPRGPVEVFLNHHLVETLQPGEIKAYEHGGSVLEIMHKPHIIHLISSKD